MVILPHKLPVPETDAPGAFTVAQVPPLTVKALAAILPLLVIFTVVLVLPPGTSAWPPYLLMVAHVALPAPVVVHATEPSWFFSSITNVPVEAVFTLLVIVATTPAKVGV